jgi:hypothetical protein
VLAQLDHSHSLTLTYEKAPSQPFSGNLLQRNKGSVNSPEDKHVPKFENGQHLTADCFRLLEHFQFGIRIKSMDDVGIVDC